LFLQPSETRLLLEPQVGFLEALLPPGNPVRKTRPATQFNT
jgi:hypothetical protein